MTEKDHLLRDIEIELKDMTEEEKQKVLEFLWSRLCAICKD